ncbi:MAG: hypothetical protein ACXVHS_10330, partial [Methanobacterium sp.]
FIEEFSFNYKKEYENYLLEHDFGYKMLNKGNYVASLKSLAEAFKADVGTEKSFNVSFHKGIQQSLIINQLC